MNTTSNSVKNVTKSEIFSLMNKLKKQHNISQKEAYAMAKEMLTNTIPADNNVAEKLMSAMQRKNVKFSFKNRGKLIVTTGTLIMDKAPVAKRKVQGSQKPKNDNMVIFYDVRHGVYRQFDKTQVVEILSKI